jgi:DKNYY family/S-layer homology domain
MKIISQLLIASTLMMLIPLTAFAGGGGWRFKDVPETHPYYDSIDYFRGLEKLFGDTSPEEDFVFKMEYRPDDNLTRAEFATLIYRMSPTPRELASFNYHDCFPDVENEWYAPFACWAKDKGYVKGYEGGEMDGMYGPAEPIRMGEMTVALSRIYGWDTEEEGTWYDPAMNYGKKVNITNETQFSDLISRGYVAELFYRSMMFNSGINTMQGIGRPMDMESIKYLGNVYSKDKDQVFNNKGGIFGFLDTATTEVLPNGFIKDADSVYSSTGLIEEADAATFEHVKGRFYKDTNSVYKFDPSLSYPSIINITDELGMLPATFEVIAHDDSRGQPAAYVTDGTKVVYFLPTPTGRYELDFADPETLKVIPDTYFRQAKDKDHVYVEGYINEAADPATYEMLEDPRGQGPYSKDNQYVFIGGRIVFDAAPETFESLNYGYGRDDEHVFYSGFPVDGADPSTFETLNFNSAKDANHAYYGTQLITEADVATYEVDGNWYTKDKDHVFKNGQILEQFDAVTFKSFNRYVRDINGVYDKYNDFSRVEIATDPMSFEEYLNVFTKDDDNVYCNEKILEIPEIGVIADSASFEYLSGSYAKDANHVYYNCNVLQGADAQYFTVSR